MPTEKSDVSLEEQSKIIRAKQEWEQTFDAVSDLIFIVDKEYTIVRANRAMANRCGMTPMALLGQKCFEVMHCTKSVPEGCPYSALFEFGKPQTTEFYVEKLNGTFEVTMSPMFNADGQITASVHVARDVTEKPLARRANH